MLRTLAGRTVGPEHPVTLLAVHPLAKVHALEGRHAEAEPLLAEVLKARERTLGPGHSDTLVSLNFLAWHPLVELRRNDAAPLLERLARQWSDPADWKAAWVRPGLALAAGDENGDPRALEQRTAVLGQDHERVQRYLSQLKGGQRPLTGRPGTAPPRHSP